MSRVACVILYLIFFFFFLLIFPLFLPARGKNLLSV